MGNLQSLESQYGESGTLSKVEVDRLERRLRKQGRGRAEVARSDLRAIDGLSQSPFVERIFQMFDLDRDGFLMLPDMKEMMELFIKLRDDEARCKFAFSVFDKNGDGYIDKAELTAALSMTNKRGMTPEQLQGIVASMMRRWDKGGTGRLAYSDFRELLTASAANLAL